MVLKNKTKKIFSVTFLTLCLSFIFSLEVPALKGRVNDYAGIINQNTENQITKYLDDLENTTGIQLAVLTIPSLKGDDLASFSIKTCEKWKLGQKGKDNGALLLVAYDEHAVRIEVGYGLEDKLTDAKSGLIIRNVIIPEFKNGRYSEGILKGIQNMGGIASDDASLVSRSVINDDAESSIEGLLFLIVWLIFFIIIITSKGGIFKWIILSNMMGGGRSGHYHSNSSGFHSSGFGGGSSFHGGGGHFGGGGASGHW